MKVLIKLSSAFYTEDQMTFTLNNMIEIDWTLDVLPRVGEWFEVYAILEDKIPDFDQGDLTWHVQFVEYVKRNGEIMPAIWLVGE